jgi:hypothetical protein
MVGQDETATVTSGAVPARQHISGERGKQAAAISLVCWIQALHLEAGAQKQISSRNWEGADCAEVPAKVGMGQEDE